MAVNFTFRRPLSNTHPVNFVFGEDDSGTAVTAVLVTASLPAPTAQFVAETFNLVEASFNFTLPPPAASFVGEYDLAVYRGPQGIAGARWQVATPVQSDTDTAWDTSTPIKPDRAMPWGSTRPLHAARPTAWDSSTRQQRSARARWEEATARLSPGGVARWQETSRIQRTRRLVYEEATPLRSDPTALTWQEMTRLRNTLAGHWSEATARRQQVSAGFGQGTRRVRSTRYPWDEARKPPPGRSIITPPEPPIDEPCYTPPPGDEVHLVFKDPLTHTTHFIFSCGPDDGENPPALVVVPIRRVYMQLNETSLWRVDGDVHIPTYAISMSLDVDSWTWSFNASVPAQALATIEPDTDGTPVELEVRLNGATFRVLAEGLSRDRQHANSRLTIRGRGKAAFLDAPYAPIKNFGSDEDRTAQQLMNDVLTLNGVGIGWDVDWGLIDWLVPGGTWSGQGTFIQGVNAIAAAAGGYVQPHRTDQELRVLPRYPFAPWQWAAEVTPDYELPAAVAQREAIEWIEKVRYNRVFVQGQVNGVRGQVTRAGTDGGLVAQMVVDSLMTHSDAVRQRGIAVLSDTGRQAKVSIRLPVLDETSVIEPGKFVRFVDGSTTRLGIVRSTSVEIGHPDVWQQLVLETHP